MNNKNITFPELANASVSLSNNSEFDMYNNILIKTLDIKSKCSVIKKQMQSQTPGEISRRTLRIYDNIKESSPNRRVRHPSGDQFMDNLKKYVQNQDKPYTEINPKTVYIYERELFGKYNLPSNFNTAQEILNTAKGIVESISIISQKSN